MTQTPETCVTPRHPRHPMTDTRVTDDTPPPRCVTTKPQVNAANDADDAGDAEIRTSDTRGRPAPRKSAPSSPNPD
ncbi:hypothetical protein GCM10018782_19440 [Streptomyces griseoaurantiacus]|nr:hypothetical protein GCM10018782_19440 [Streptomyces griseoaurantiacus]